MPILFQNLLIGHILLGLAGIVFSVLVLVGFFKREAKPRFLKKTSLAAFLLYLASWVAGGYYYVEYYGNNVKPLIKAGAYPFAHGIFMEAKEHIFLFIPILAGVIFIASWLLGDKINQEPKIKIALTVLAFVVVFLGVLITAVGMLISGSVK
ncbi:MAG: hypothetical protein AAB851_02045 [Patescibacteria group bacterium]